MINDKLPEGHDELAALIVSIAPDVKVERRGELHCAGPNDRVLEVGRWSPGACFPQMWHAHGHELHTELDLVERLCWLVDAPRLAGPADVAETLDGERAKYPGLKGTFQLERQCVAALQLMDSSAILACSRALPNNDWRKHQP